MTLSELHEAGEGVAVTFPGMPERDIPAGLTAEQAAIVAQQAATYAAQQQQLRAQLIGALAAVWVGVAAAQTFSPQAAAKFVAQILPVSLGAQRAMAAITQAQLAAQVQPPRPIVISPEAVTGAALRGVSPEEYMQRPFKTVRYELSKGRTLEQALDAGARRARDIVAADLQLAHTHTARDYLAEAERRRQEAVAGGRALALAAGQRARATRQEPAMVFRRRVVGYRRTLSSSPNHCALCLLASTQRYHIENLMPIHPNCGCTVTPIFAGEPDRHVLDPNLARRVHEIVARDLGESYKDPGGGRWYGSPKDSLYRNIIITNDHGELGPVLGVRGQQFQGPDDLKQGHIRVNPEPDAPAPDPGPTNL